MQRGTHFELLLKLTATGTNVFRTVHLKPAGPTSQLIIGLDQPRSPSGF